MIDCILYMHPALNKENYGCSSLSYPKYMTDVLKMEYEVSYVIFLHD